MIRVVLPLLLLGCPEPSPVPRIHGVQDDWMYNGEPKEVVVRGERFIPEVVVDTLTGHPVVRTPITVSLRATGLPEAPAHVLTVAEHSDTSTVKVVVPAQLEPGLYDVEVALPGGGRDVLEGGFQIRDFEVSHIALDPDAHSHEALTAFEIRVFLQDDDGDPVQDDLRLVMRLEGEEGEPVDGELGGDWSTFEHVQRRNPLEVVASLGYDGAGVLRPVLNRPGRAHLRVFPEDPDVPLADAVLSLEWELGSRLRLRVEPILPSDPVPAGTDLAVNLQVVDEHGFPAENAVFTGVLMNACLTDIVSVQGVGGVSVERFSVRRATVGVTGVCDHAAILDPLGGHAPHGPNEPAHDHLVVLATIIGVSDPFQVAPGPHVGWVFGLPSEADAGEPVTILLTPVDAWGNRTTPQGEILEIRDATGPVPFACGTGVPQVCEIELTRATEGTPITVVTSTVSATSTETIRVLPTRPHRVIVEATDPVWVAGEAGEVAITVVDVFDNPLPPDAGLDEDGVTVDAGDGPVACAAGEPGDGVVACTLTRAGPAVLDVDVPWRDGFNDGRFNAQVAVEVRNGPLHHVVVTVPEPEVQLPVRAGGQVLLTLEGYDAFGNPWSHKPDGGVVLDASPHGEAVAAGLDADGVGAGWVRLVRAGEATVRVRRQGVEVGRSAPIPVVASNATRLVLALAEPWAFVDEPLPVVVEALDPHGNRAALSTTVELSSRTALGPPVAVTMEDGVAEGAFTWTSWTLSDRLDARADDGGLTATSASVAVVRRCAPAASPVLDVDFGGRPYALACFEGGAADVTATFLSEPVAGRSMVAHAFALGSEVMVVPGGQATLPAPGMGSFPVRGLAVQDDGCGVEAASRAWIGPDDDSVTGPLDVRVSRAEVHVDHPDPVTKVDVFGATTCRGDLAADAELRVRTDRGTVRDAVPTGSGLAVRTSAVGSASFRVDASGLDVGGLATVSVWTPDGTAFGSDTFRLRGDHRRPVVQALGTKPAPGGGIERITVRLSEAPDSRTVPAAVQLSGPFPVGYGVGMDDERTVVVLPDAPLPDHGTGWTVIVGPELKDLAGNGLAGTWAGVAAPFVGTVGAMGTAPVVTTCALSLPVFRPDGDDGPADEADRVRFSFAATAQPAWWALEVSDATGELLWAEQRAASSSADGWTWDGRDASGAVVRDGVYRLAVDTVGSSGVRGGRCSREVRVALVQVDP